MNILIWITISIVFFAFFTVMRHYKDVDVLILLAIGCAINANIFNGGTVPFKFCGAIFGIDSILYTLFMFTVMYRLYNYSKKDAWSMTLTTLAAIMVSAVIEVCAKWTYEGTISSATITSLIGYVSSTVGTFFGVFFMIMLYEHMHEKKVSVYLSFVICIILASVINTTIYFGGIALVSGPNYELVHILSGSYIGKLFNIIIGLIGFYINNHFLKPRNVPVGLK